MKPRLDQMLVQRGLVESRERAQRSIMAGAVFVDGQRVDKAGVRVAEAVAIEVRGRSEPYVSRAGRKLAEALERFDVEPRGRVCLDIGASTGGFTDCLLQRGASRVYAVDVGYGQLDSRLRSDSRVVVMERLNARYLEPGDLPEPVELVTVDVSFISVLKVMPAVVGHMVPGAVALILIKPQFEAGREQVQKGGVVRDQRIRRQVIEARLAGLAELGFVVLDAADCSLTGVAGNREAFGWLRWPGSAATELRA